MRYSEDLDLLRQAAHTAGPVAMSYFKTNVKSWDKGDDDPVSEADHAVNDCLRDILTAARPDYGWMSEEDPDDLSRLEKQRVWVVDPIDGTRSFLKNVPEFTICAALVEAGRPIAGVVFNPAKDQMFEASVGGGARLNGVAIQASTHGTLDDARLLAGKKVFERAGWRNMPKNASFHYVNSIAYRMVMVANGEYDACLSLAEKNDWDIAAAELIVIEAGGIVTTSRHEDFIYNKETPRHRSLVIAGPNMHAPLMDFLDAIERPEGRTW
jgi:myo-inositol-1(or 4)-monophosphatase